MARRRNPRVDRDVRAALADALVTEVADPRLALVTVTEVQVTPDHEVATVFWTTVDPGLLAAERRGREVPRPPRPEQVAAALEAATPLLRGAIARRLRLRTTPELRFRPDPLAEQAERVERLLRDRRAADAAAGRGAEPDADPDPDVVPDADGR